MMIEPPTHGLGRQSAQSITVHRCPPSLKHSAFVMACRLLSSVIFRRRWCQNCGHKYLDISRGSCLYTERSSRERYQRQLVIWNRLRNCTRDHVIFDPDTQQYVPAEARRSLLPSSLFSNSFSGEISVDVREPNWVMAEDSGPLCPGVSASDEFACCIAKNPTTQL